MRGNAPWKIPRKIKKQGRKKILERFFESCSSSMNAYYVRRCIKLHWAPLVGWTITANSIWNENRARRKSKAKLLFSRWRGYDFDADCNNEFDADCEDFDNWFDNWDGDSDGHGFDCDCEFCKYERDAEKCGRFDPHATKLPCTKVGSEYCDFECPFRNLQEEYDKENDE